jgi:hypothetical protein
MPNAPKKRTPWKTAGDVERLWIPTRNKSHDRNQKRIAAQVSPGLVGEGHFGKVFVGRMRFRNGAIARVAIKRFLPIDDALAARYQQTIGDLVRARVSLPKMAMAHLSNGEWVLVSQLFGSTEKRSKFYRMDLAYLRMNRESRIDAAQELTRVANAGYAVHPMMGDIMEPFKPDRKGSVPLDIDLIARGGKSEPKIVFKQLADEIEELRGYAESIRERKEILATALQNASPDLQKVLRSRFGLKPAER